jgi:hypothetical protein
VRVFFLFLIIIHSRPSWQLETGDAPDLILCTTTPVYTARLRALPNAHGKRYYCWRFRVLYVPLSSCLALFSRITTRDFISPDVLYDCMHYAYVAYIIHYLPVHEMPFDRLHHTTLPKYMREMKKYHLAHHYKNFELGFGVTSCVSNGCCADILY